MEIVMKNFIPEELHGGLTSIISHNDQPLLFELVKVVSSYDPLIYTVDLEKVNRTNLKNMKYDISYLKMSKDWGENSYSTRKQVGALLVKDNHIISDGFNGTPSGFSNKCEDSNGQTHWYVIHAEANALMKVARSGYSCEGATMYTTVAPCQECSKLIIQAQIKEIVFSEFYRNLEGLKLILNNTNIKVKFYNLDVAKTIDFNSIVL